MTRSSSRGSRSNPNLPIYLLMAGMVALIFVVLLILPGLSSGGGTVVPTPFARPASTDNTLGDPQAPLRVEEFADFQCPFCGRFFAEVEPRMTEAYIVPGRVYFVYRQFPILGAASVRAAEASLCAREQGAFWPYHDILFVNQDETDPQVFSADRLREFAVSVGMDGNTFQDCADRRQFAGEVQADAQAALAAGMDSTPTFLINGRSLKGLLSYEEFSQILEQALSGNAP